MNADVVVVGGGIGGLANAYALAMAGHRVRVLERSPEFAEVGAGLQLAPNATRVLRQWGLLDEVIAAGVLRRRLVFKDALDGSELTHVGLGEDFVRRYRAPYVLIHRTDLLSILVQACERAGVELVPNCAVSDVDTDETGAVVHSATGPHQAGMVVAADGLRSSLRKKLSPDEPICSGYVAYRGAFPIQDVDLDENAHHDVTVYLGPGCHLVHYTLRRGEIFNTVAVFESAAYHRGEDDWGGPEELDEVFARTCSPVRARLRSLWRDRRWPMYDRLPISRWVHGSMVLTGDAAHPMLQYLAQGACQAIEDAQCLALASRKYMADWTHVLTEYETQRTARTARVQTTARLWGDIWHVDGIARILRNELFRRQDTADGRYMDWLYGTTLTIP